MLGLRRRLLHFFLPAIRVLFDQFGIIELEPVLFFGCQPVRTKGVKGGKFVDAFRAGRS